jgi:hypothetical protein
MLCLVGVDDSLDAALAVLAHGDELLVGVLLVLLQRRRLLAAMLLEAEHLGGLDLDFSLQLAVSVAELTQPLKLLVLALCVGGDAASDAELLLGLGAAAVAVHEEALSILAAAGEDLLRSGDHEVLVAGILTRLLPLVEQMVLRFCAIQTVAVIVRFGLEARGALVGEDLSVAVGVPRLTGGEMSAAVEAPRATDVGQPP